MWVLVTAIVTASLLGSMHCVGMCGPLAIWASGASEKASRGRVIASTSLYHVGRLITYMIAGLIAGGIGSLVEIGGQTLGFQLVAARIVGTIMILIGLWKLASMWLPQRRKEVSGPQPSRIGGMLVKLRPLIFGLPPSGRALATGLLTTLLPCGWLYLFALVAAGTGDPMTGAIAMAAFWVGTVPALTALIAGTQTLSRRFVQFIPTATAVLLIVTGGVTASGRGFANLHSMSEIKGSVEISGNGSLGESTTGTASVGDRINALVQTPLPCCGCVGEKKCDLPEASANDSTTAGSATTQSATAQSATTESATTESLDP